MGCIQSRAHSDDRPDGSTTLAGASSSTTHAGGGRARRPSTSATGTSLDDDHGPRVAIDAAASAAATTTSPDAHPSPPAIRIARWVDRHGKWTRAGLDREREAFFDTRVTGFPYIWEALHSALRFLWEEQRREQARGSLAERSGAEGRDDEGVARPDAQTGDAGDQGDQDAPKQRPAPTDAATPRPEAREEALTQMKDILARTDVTIPSGYLNRGVFDALGNLYELPKWVINDPTNLPDDDDADKDGESSDHELSDEMDFKREEKGKGLATPEADKVAIRIRLSTGKDVVVQVSRSLPTRRVRGRIANAAKLDGPRSIRLFVRGAELKGSRSLLEQGWIEGEVITGLVFE